MIPQQLRHPRRGFTLIELGVVVAIIGIIIGFILVASYEAVERGQVRATQGLIAKLDAGITERLDALANQTVVPNGAHRFMAAIYPPGTGTALPWGLPSEERAQVIARFDYLKAEMPDVFWMQYNLDPLYPFNFAAQAYPPSSVAPSSANRTAFVLPLGHLTTPGYQPNSINTSGATPVPYNLGPGANYLTAPAGPTVNAGNPSGTGIYGASYVARAALNKLLGMAPAGYDLIDNDGDGLIDEMDASEGFNGLTAAQQAEIITRLGNHTHGTARAECLYALLVGGLGPLGSVFSESDFSPTEVADTDNDGLPEFVDAFGEPLQFFRWPIHYVNPPVQLGFADYPINDPAVPREQDPLDPNNLLVAPGWWAFGASPNNFNGPAPIGGGDPLYSFSDPYYAAPGIVSGRAAAFMWFFHSLAEYNPVPPSPTATSPDARWWSRVGSLPRRAYFSRPLIVSGGPDRRVGIGRVGFDYSLYDGNLAPGSGQPLNSTTLIQLENTAAPLAPFRVTGSTAGGRPYFIEDAPSGSVGEAVASGLRGLSVPSAGPSTAETDTGWIFDDITNQNLQTAGGGLPQ